MPSSTRPVSKVDKIIDNFGEAAYLSKLDMAKGFHQVPVAPEDIPKASFSIPFRNFEYFTKLFGLRMFL